MVAPSVSEELRTAEREIDNHYKANPLIQERFAEAAWSVMAASEEQLVLNIVRNPDGMDRAAEAVLSDRVVVNAKWPLRWIQASCRRGGRIPSRFNDRHYQAASDLYQLALNYGHFEGAFTYASIGVLSLYVSGKRISASDGLRRDTRYDAYDRLRQRMASDAQLGGIDILLAGLAKSVRFKDQWFSYDTSPRFLEDAIAVLSPLIDARFDGGEEWAFSEFTLREFRAAARLIFVLSYLHFNARVIAAAQGCIGLGYGRALYVTTIRELLDLLRMHAGLRRPTAARLVDILTLGNRDQRKPDPALQPLIRFNERQIGFAPSLVINSSMERNLVALVNRLPTDRKIYESLSEERETLSRDVLDKAINALGFRSWFGHVPAWGKCAQIDLIVISDVERHCLVLELKSFIGPADPREVHERSLEIMRGIEQIRERRAKAADIPDALLKAARIDGTYGVSWAVLSESSVGAPYVQSSDVAVVQQQHFIDKLQHVRRLRAVCEWVQAQEHLPIEGVHYRTVDFVARVGDWELDWYGIQPLMADFT